MHLNETGSAHKRQILQLLSQFPSLCLLLDLQANLLLDQSGRSVDFVLVLVETGENLHSPPPFFLLFLRLSPFNLFLGETHSQEALKFGDCFLFLQESFAED